MTYDEVLPIWWSFAWRWAIVGTIGGYFAGVMEGLVGALVGFPGIETLSAASGLLVGVPISIWATRAAINKHGLRPMDEIQR